MSLNPLQLLLTTRIAAMSFFKDPVAVPVFTEDDGDLQNLILQKLGSLECGLAVSVLVPTGRHCDPRRGAPTNLLLEPEISVTENAIINRGAGGAQKPAYTAIREIMRDAARGGVSNWCPGAPFSRLDLIDFQSDSGLVKGANIIIYSARFECRELIS